MHWAKEWLNETKLSNYFLLSKKASISHIFETSIYYLFDDIFYLIIIIENLLKKIRPKVLISPYYCNNQVTGIDHIKERYLFDIAKIISKNFDIELRPDPQVAPYSKTALGPVGDELFETDPFPSSKLHLPNNSPSLTIA